MLHTTFQMMHEVGLRYGLLLMQHTVYADDLGHLRAGSFQFQFVEKTKTGLHKYPNPVLIGMTVNRMNNPNSPQLVFVSTNGLVTNNVDPGFKPQYSVELVINLDGVQISSRKLLQSVDLTPDGLCAEIFKIIGPYWRVPRALDALWEMFKDNPGLVSEGMEISSRSIDDREPPREIE